MNLFLIFLLLLDFVICVHYGQENVQGCSLHYYLNEAIHHLVANCPLGRYNSRSNLHFIVGNMLYHNRGENDVVPTCTPRIYTFIYDDIALVAKCNFAVHFLFSLSCRTLSITLFLHEELPLLVELELL